MDRNYEHDADLEDRLRQERPQLAPLEADRLKRVVLSRVAMPSASRAPGFLRSRLALTFLLAGGLMMSGTGATLAVTGIAGGGNALESQYTPPGANAPDQGGVQGEQEQGDVLGETQAGGNAPTEATSPESSPESSPRARATEQVAAESGADTLPFTGLVVFPLLLGGVALLATGLVIRRRVQE